MKNELTAFEADTFHDQEKIIEETKNSFVKCGTALARIQIGKLYRKDFKSFEEYCQKKWGWTRQRAHQLIDASGVVKKLPKKVSTIVDSEGVARELAKVPEAQRVEVLEAAQSAGKVTAASIEAAAEAVAPKPKLKQGREVWGPKERKACCAAFGKFVRLVDKAPYWGEIKGLVEAVAKELKR